jgi:hypothetical protein
MARNLAARIIDKPSYAMHLRRYQQMVNDAQYEEGFPTRLQGKIPVRVPILPDWMGDELWFDPMSVVPFPPLTDPYEPQDIEEAGAFERFYAKATSIMSPWPMITWALAGAGILQPKEMFVTGSQIPVLRYMRAVARLRGLDIAEHPALHPIRSILGMSPQDNQDVYYVERMLGFLAQSGEIEEEDAQVVMLAHAGPTWEFAKQRAMQQRGARTLISTTLPRADVYPPAEQEIRQLRLERDAAIEGVMPGYGDMTYEETQAARAADPALDQRMREFWNQWYETHPEYQVRSMLWQEPDERVRRYAITQIWEGYNERERISKRLATIHLGSDFERYFRDKNTRDYTQFKTEDLVEFAAALQRFVPGGQIGMTGEQLGQLPLSQPTITPPTPAAGFPTMPPPPTAVEVSPSGAITTAGRERRPGPAPVAPQEAEQKLEGFRQQVEQATGKTMDEIFADQREWGQTPERSQERRDFVAAHPHLPIYWEMNRRFKAENPDVEALLTRVVDPEEAMAERVAAARAPAQRGRYMPRWNQELPFIGGERGRRIGYRGGRGGRRGAPSAGVMSWDAFMRSAPSWVVQELAAHLRDGGPVSQRLLEWIQGTGMAMVPFRVGRGNWRGWLQMFGSQVYGQG